MRVVAEIVHPACRISIFSMNQKFIIKFEQGALEQTYKVSEMDLPHLETVKQMIDEEFVNTVLERFILMRSAFASALQKVS